MNLASLGVALREHGWSWDELRAASDGVFLFGSRAAGCEREGSDWDLLCVGDGASVMRPGLDLLWVPRARTGEERWRGTELASHVANWGICLHGEGGWLCGARPAHAAVELKRKVLQGRVNAHRQIRASSTRVHRTRLESIRRDAQRLAWLEAGEAVPPSAHLDRDWKRPHERQRTMSTLRTFGWFEDGTSPETT